MSPSVRIRFIAFPASTYTDAAAPERAEEVHEMKGFRGVLRHEGPPSCRPYALNFEMSNLRVFLFWSWLRFLGRNLWSGLSCLKRRICQKTYQSCVSWRNETKTCKTQDT